MKMVIQNCYYIKSKHCRNGGAGQYRQINVMFGLAVLSDLITLFRRALRKVARFKIFSKKNSTFAFVLMKAITFRFSLRKLSRLSGLPCE